METATAPAPAAPTIVHDRPAPKPLPAPTREIRVSTMAPSNPKPTPQPPPEPEPEEREVEAAPEKPATPPQEKSQREKIREKLEETANKKARQDAPPEPTPQPTPEPEKGKKVSPWKLLDAEKKARALAEQQLQEVKKGILPESDRKSIEERLTKAEQRAKELEDEIRFVDYQKSDEFKTKYRAPYEDAWKRAMTELSEITVPDGKGGERAVSTEDVLQLVNLPLGQARDIADERFGKFADDVMAHRKEIRRLFEAQSQALEEAKAKGGEREKMRQEEMQNFQRSAGTEISQTWQQLTEGLLADPKNGVFFKPRVAEEGKELSPEDAAWNDALEKGENLVKEAWSLNPLDKTIDSNKRKEIVAKHLAVWKRAAAFGAVKSENIRLQSLITSLQKELAEYKSTTPSTEGGRQPSGGGGGGDARSRLRSELAKFATK